MAYAPLDEHFDEHPKYESLDLEHYGLMACAITYCNRNLTDGKVSFKAVRGFGKSGKGPKYAKRLTDAGIWRDIETGWEIVGYLDHNPSRAEVLAKREAARARKDAYRKGSTLTIVPASVPAGQDAGRTVGQSVGRPTGQDAGQDAGQTRRSQGVSLARAPVPAGGIRSTALHSTATDPPVVPQGDAGVQTRSSPPADEFRIPAGLARLERDAWIQAYTAGIEHIEPGFTFKPQTFATLERVVSKRLPPECRSNIAAWIEREAERFARAVAANPAVWSGFSADGFERWWNSRCPVVSDAPSGARTTVPAAIGDDLQPPAAPAERLSEERLAEIRSGRWLTKPKVASDGSGT
jgi:hypothetical protein